MYMRSMNLAIKSFIVILVLLSAGYGIAADETQDLLGDPKNWKLGPPNSWRLEEGVLKIDRVDLTASATLVGSDYKEWPGYMTTVKVRVTEPDPKRPGGFNGIIVKGVRFLIRKDGLWGLYQKPSGKYEGVFKKVEITPSQWSEIRVVTKGKAIKGFVNGKP